MIYFGIKFNHNYLGTEHLLLGLIGMPEDDMARRVLMNLGVEAAKVRSAIEFIIGRGERAVIGEVGLTPRAKKTIELAEDERRRLTHPQVLPAHLLLGLIREGEGIAAGILENMGVNLRIVRREVRIMMVLQKPEDKTAPETVPPISFIAWRLNNVLNKLPLQKRSQLTRLVGHLLDLAKNS